MKGMYVQRDGSTKIEVLSYILQHDAQTSQWQVSKIPVGPGQVCSELQHWHKVAKLLYAIHSTGCMQLHNLLRVQVNDSIDLHGAYATKGEGQSGPAIFAALDSAFRHSGVH